MFAGLPPAPLRGLPDGAADLAMEWLHQIASGVRSARKLARLTKILTQWTAWACQADRCSLFLSRHGAFVPMMAQFASGRPDPEAWRAFRGLGPCQPDQIPGFARALRELAPVGADAATLLPPEWVEAFGVGSLLIVPLVRGHRCLGIITLDYGQEPVPLTDAEVRAARQAAGPLAAALEAACTVNEVRHRLRSTETLLSVARTVGSTLELAEVARRISREAARALGADSAGIYLVSESKRVLQPLAAYRIPKDLLESLRSEPIVLAEPVADLKMRWSDDVANDPVFQHEIFWKRPPQSLLLTPLRTRDDVVGVLVSAWWTERRRLADEELRLMEGIGQQAAVAIANARLYARAEEMAVDRERVRVDSILHDTLSQTLFSMAVKVELCLKRLRRSSASRTMVESIKRDAALMMSQIRQLLAPAAAGQAPPPRFSERLAKLVQDFRTLTGMPVLLTERGESARIGSAQWDILATIFETGLGHIATRAGATQAEIRLDVQPAEVRFELKADGTNGEDGLPPGITQMTQRLRRRGVRLELGRPLSAGFRLRGVVPLLEESHA
jgi:GAF domain-containing protein